MSEELRLEFEVLRALRLLGVDSGSTAEEVRAAYRELVKVWHPDRFQDDPGLQTRAEEELKKINAAYDLIRAHQARALEMPSDASVDGDNTAASWAPPVEPAPVVGVHTGPSMASQPTGRAGWVLVWVLGSAVLFLVVLLLTIVISRGIRPVASDPSLPAAQVSPSPSASSVAPSAPVKAVTTPEPVFAEPEPIEPVTAPSEPIRTKCIVCSGKGRSSCLLCGGLGSKVCIICGGSGFDECVICKGAGIEKCFMCAGSGQSFSGGVCSTCGGLGVRACDSCGGEGGNSCTFCLGRGEERCAYCAGAGWDPCTVCSGTGYVEY